MLSGLIRYVNVGICDSLVELIYCYVSLTLFNTVIYFDKQTPRLVSRMNRRRAERPYVRLSTTSPKTCVART
jgi:hypothetical protein